MHNLSRKDIEHLSRQLQQVVTDSGIPGFDIHVGNCPYDSTEAIFKVHCKSSNHAAKKDEELDLKMKLYGLNKTGNGVTLIGYERKNRKYPFIVRKDNGVDYKMTREQVTRYLGK